MRIINAHSIIETDIHGQSMLQSIERAGRTCYKSEDRITPDSAEKFVRMIIERGHESVLEHEKVTVRFVVDRGVSHELVRHRLSSFSQESSRYCNYSKDKHDGEITFILPCWGMDADTQSIWERNMLRSEADYFALLELGWTPEKARSVLSHSLKTEVVITSNLRQWRTIFKQRTSPAAHPQMREVMIPLLHEMQGLIPVVFDDIEGL